MKYGCFGLIALLGMVLAGIPNNLTPLWVLPLFMLIYFILSDLYYDIGARNITWLILWLVVMSAFLSTILYRYDFDRDIKNRTIALDSYFQSVDNERLQVYQLEHQYKFETIKSNIETHPQLGQIDGVDMVESTFNIIDHTTIELSAFSQDTSAIYTDQDDVSVKSNLWTDLGNDWHFEPVDHIYRKVDIIKTETDTITHYTDYVNYAYAKYVDIPITIIKDGRITDNALNLTEDDVIKLMATDQEKAYIDSELYIVHRPIEGYLVVTNKPIFSILKPVTLFSFFFCLLTILVIVFMSANGRLDFLPEFLPLRFTKDTGLSTRIQLIIVGMVIFSFMAIATITSFYLQSQIAKNSNQQTQNRIRTISNSMLWHLQSIDQSKNTAYFLDNIRLELEEVHDVGIQLYHSNGQNVANASEYIPYLAYHHFKLDYLSNPLTFKNGNSEISYIPFRSGKTEEQIYASVSHTTPRSASLGVVDYLGTLLNIYVFLFLIAGAVALAIARSITEPLETLANRMKETKLNKKNIPVEWKADDEIGKLINNYNSMINELEDSAQLIARTERDGAWKEMARNVAHEIKNPLTPMKLSIQYLERAVKQKPDQAESLVKRISNSIIEQIDNLAKIADAFSNFGQMPQANNEKIVLNDIVETIHDLFRKRDDMTIQMSEPIEDLLIFADRNHLVSILNNLLKNAIQSIPNDREGNISIDLYKEDGNAIIKVSDNGIGIPNDMKSKIFTPNFTTKSSGSGLGLAISSNMIEAFNGKMYFESIEGVGSKFYISIPLMKHFVDTSDPDLLMLDD
jgi:signal transduction histidine kinase